MKLNSVRFYETGICGELELHDVVIECGDHTFEREGIHDAIEIVIGQPTIVICPICGKKGKVELTIDNE